MSKFRSFKKAREFVRKLGIKTHVEWRDYINSNELPPDIPRDLSHFYKKTGKWKSWADFLGTKNKKGGWRSFEKAREFVRKLGIKTQSGWSDYCKSGNKPADIPIDVRKVYKKEWKGLGDFLGTGRIAYQNRKYGSYKETSKFAQKHGIKTQVEWRDYINSNELPPDIPRDPFSLYRKKGEWKSWGDFLGTKNRKGGWRSFEKAREYARKLGLKTQIEWYEHCKSDSFPADIPSNVRIVYKKEWKYWGDFLGTKNRKGGWRSFEKAREYARKLGLKNKKEWNEHCKSDSLPADIPSNLPGVYGKEWTGWGDVLDTGFIANKDREYRSFKEARKFARKLGIQSQIEWYEHSKSGSLPADIPAQPRGVYKKEWTGWGDFLGTGNIGRVLHPVLPIKEAKIEARKIAKKLGIKTARQWHDAYKAGKIPSNLPGNLWATYYYEREKRKK